MNSSRHVFYIWICIILTAIGCTDQDPKGMENDFEGDAPNECIDGADNDRNGVFDCDDPGCLNSPACNQGRDTEIESSDTTTTSDSQYSEISSQESFDQDTATSTDLVEEEICGSSIKALIRDFSRTHPDFQSFTGDGASKGLVEERLGDDSKPIFKSTMPEGGGKQQITSEETFKEWYNTIDGINQEFEIELPLTKLEGDLYEFSSSAFFPLDSEETIYGLEGNTHNFYFTTEIHLKFIFHGGEIFTFEGDDDLWLFINNRLVLDLGGLHTELEGEVILDSLGLEKEKEYSMEIFHAERRTSSSNFKITTSIQCIQSYYPVVK